MVRSHAQIIREAGAPAIFVALAREGVAIPNIGRVHAWALRDSIPGEYWNAFARAGFATLEELAAYAETKKAITSSEDAPI